MVVTVQIRSSNILRRYNGGPKGGFALYETKNGSLLEPSALAADTASLYIVPPKEVELICSASAQFYRND